MAKEKLSGLSKAILETADGIRRVGIMDAETHGKITMRHLGRPAPMTEPINARKYARFGNGRS